MPVTAFVLSGGMSLGALQVGMLAALFERGVRADMLVGTSAGALNAAFLASRPQTPAAVRALGDVWRGLRREDIVPASPRAVLGALSHGGDHVVSDRGLRRLAHRHLELEWLEEAQVPLHLIAFDTVSGEEVRLSCGPAVPALLAATAVPGLLPPVRAGARLLVDGGVINNTPISHAVELGAERIFVLATQSSERGRPLAPQTAMGAALSAITLLVAGRLGADLERYGDATELIVLPAANPARVQPTDFSQADRLIAGARDAARATLARPFSTSVVV